MEGRLGEHHAGELKREGAEAKGERIIREGLTRLRWTENDLRERPKSDPAKAGDGGAFAAGDDLDAAVGGGAAAVGKLEKRQRKTAPMEKESRPPLN
jgi:hypothetical protein